MFSIIESFRSALQSIRAHGFRSFLTTLGIIIGVASVITVISIVQGLSHSVKGEFEGLGANSLTVYADTSREDFLQGKRSYLSINDYEKIIENIEGISNVSPFFSPFNTPRTQVKFGAQSSFTQVSAVKSVYQKTNQLFPQYGRFISDSDELSRRKVTVIGSKLRDNLKLPQDPVGKFIDIGGEWFKVIGVNESQGDMFGFSKDDYALIPFSVGQSISGNSSKLNIVVTFNVDDMEQLVPIQDRLTSLLRQLHHLKPGEKNDFKVDTSDQLMETFSSIIDMLTLVLGGIVSISLLVGGIGIMNIMLVSVTERTREIGICKALGAQRHHILMQFLIEAMVLSLLGGIIGLGLGFFFGFIAAKMIPGFPDAYVPFWAIALSLGFSTAVGMVFGIMPAAKAANLDPIDALRYE